MYLREYRRKGKVGTRSGNGVGTVGVEGEEPRVETITDGGGEGRSSEASPLLLDETRTVTRSTIDR